jgi:hypothetical protein
MKLSFEARARMLEWLESGTENERRHARNRLAIDDADPSEPPPPPTPEDLALRAFVAEHGCGGCGGARAS